MHTKHFNKVLIVAGLTVITVSAVNIVEQINAKTLESNTFQETAKTPIDTQPKQPEKKTKPDLTNLEIPIFMYHHIDYSKPDQKTASYLAVSSKKLQNQLDLIQKLGYTPTNFQNIENGEIPEKPIILTFDDAYDDFYTKAFPELQKRNMTAVIYLPSNKLNTKDYMTFAQIKELRNNNIEIGSHSLNHADLGSLNEENLRKEIFDSKYFLEKLTDKKVLSFCYPYGIYNPRIRDLLKEAGYKYGLTTKTGHAKFDRTFDLARHKVYSDTDINWYIN